LGTTRTTVLYRLENIDLKTRSQFCAFACTGSQ